MNKKFQFLLRQYCLLLHNTPDSDEVWFSSAQNLDRELKKRGINLSRDLYHKYKLPGSLTQQEYLVKKNSLNTVGRYQSGDMERLVSCLSEKDSFRKEYMKLTPDEQLAFDRYILDLVKQENQKIDVECKQIRALNPELSDLDVPNDIEFLSGVVYGFPPADIIHFMDLQAKKLGREQDLQEKENQNMLSQQLGVPITYRLSADTIKAIQLAMKNNGKE